MEGNGDWQERYFCEDLLEKRYTEGLELEDAVHIALLI